MSKIDVLLSGLKIRIEHCYNYMPEFCKNYLFDFRRLSHIITVDMFCAFERDEQND